MCYYLDNWGRMLRCPFSDAVQLYKSHTAQGWHGYACVYGGAIVTQAIVDLYTYNSLVRGNVLF